MRNKTNSIHIIMNIIYEEVYNKELVQINIKTGNPNLQCELEAWRHRRADGTGGAWRHSDDKFLRAWRGWSFSSIQASTDWMRPTHIVEGKVLYSDFTDLNINLIKPLQSDIKLSTTKISQTRGWGSKCNFSFAFPLPLCLQGQVHHFPLPSF